MTHSQRTLNILSAIIHPAESLKLLQSSKMNFFPLAVTLLYRRHSGCFMRAAFGRSDILLQATAALQIVILFVNSSHRASFEAFTFFSYFYLMEITMIS